MSRWRVYRLLLWGGVLLLVGGGLLLGVLPQLQSLRRLQREVRALGDELNRLTVARADVAPLDEGERRLLATLEEDWALAFPGEEGQGPALWEALALRWGEYGRRAGLDLLVLSVKTGHSTLSASPVWVGESSGQRELLDLMAREKTPGVKPSAEGEKGQSLPGGRELQEVRLGGRGSLACWALFVKMLVEGQEPYLVLREINLTEGTKPMGILNLSVHAGEDKEVGGG